MTTQPPTGEHDGGDLLGQHSGPRVGDRYELSGLLGRGGMAEVRMGHDLRLGRPVAVKRLRSDLAADPTFQARFRREAQSAASLNHPAIVSVYDTGEEPDSTGQSIPYIVMEYVEGKTLREILREGRKVLPERALEVVAEVLGALDYSHRAGIVHRDIKPANVMLTPNGSVKVMDFGIARAIADSSATMTATAAVVGTAQYLSPEQARGEQVDARSDIYSTGCVLYELLTGRPPFVGDSPVAVAYQHVREDAQPPSTFDPQIPPEIDAITAKALAKRIEDRYQSAAEMRADIERALAGQQIAAPAVTSEATQPYMPLLSEPTQPMTTAMPPLEPEDEHPNRRRWAYVLLGVAVLAVFVAAAIFGREFFGTSDVPQVPVPRVVDMTQAEAVQALDQVGLKADITRQNSSTKKGIVLTQDPPLGTLVDKGSKVDLTVSAGKKMVQIPPDIVDMNLQDAEAALTDLGLETKSIEEHSTETKGQVTRTDPPPGQSVPVGSSVTVWYSAGLVEVPNVINQTQDDATRQLRALGFRVIPSFDPFSSDPAGTVIGQRPTGGTKQAYGSQVVITVSSATPTPTTPTESTTTPTDTPTDTTTSESPGRRLGAPAGRSTTTLPAIERRIRSAITGRTLLRILNGMRIAQIG
jgi:serine/threonine protein kinase/beta-lactam-binding protein with PASTA domain